MRYLITGGAGFIGSHLAEALLRRGETVILLDNLSTGRLANVQHLLEEPFASSVDLRTGSVLDPLLVKRSVDEADVIVHLAASVGVQLIISRGLETVLNNIRGTEVVLEAAARGNKKTLVASTSEIYGKNSAARLNEDADRILGSPFKRRWAYATSKAVDEIFAYEYHREQGLPTVVARLFNCSGPRQTGAYGMVIPRLVGQALGGEDLTVFGSGDQRRCFCHVLDTVDGLLRLLDSEEAVGDVFNIGSENEITIRDLAELVIQLTGSSSGVRLVPYSEAYEPGFEDMQRRFPDVGKISRLTGWAPTRSLEEIITGVALHHREAPG